MKLENLAEKNAFLNIVIDDFNAKSKIWCSQDSINFEGITNENLISQFALRQLINEANHILESPLLRALILFSQQDLIW